MTTTTRYADPSTQASRNRKVFAPFGQLRWRRGISETPACVGPYNQTDRSKRARSGREKSHGGPRSGRHGRRARDTRGASHSPVTPQRPTIDAPAPCAGDVSMERTMIVDHRTYTI